MQVICNKPDPYKCGLLAQLIDEGWLLSQTRREPSLFGRKELVPSIYVPHYIVSFIFRSRIHFIITTQGITTMNKRLLDSLHKQKVRFMIEIAVFRILIHNLFCRTGLNHLKDLKSCVGKSIYYG